MCCPPTCDPADGLESWTLGLDSLTDGLAADSTIATGMIENGVRGRGMGSTSGVSGNGSGESGNEAFSRPDSWTTMSRVKHGAEDEGSGRDRDAVLAF